MGGYYNFSNIRRALCIKGKPQGGHCISPFSFLYPRSKQSLHWYIGEAVMRHVSLGFMDQTFEKLRWPFSWWGTQKFREREIGSSLSQRPLLLQPWRVNSFIVWWNTDLSLTRTNIKLRGFLKWLFHMNLKYQDLIY